MFGIADMTPDARGLLRAEREQMSYLALIESEQRACRRSGAERAAHAVRAAQGSGQCFRIERAVDARRDVVTQNDRSDEIFATGMPPLCGRKPGRNHPATRIVPRRPMRIGPV